MKKILFLTLILFLSFVVNSQEKERKFVLGANMKTTMEQGIRYRF